MNSSSLQVTLVGDNLRQEHGDFKWYDSLTVSDGCVYGIPLNARRVIRFDPKDHSTTAIGDDLGPGTWKWWGGAGEANNGCIYAVPSYNEDSILKIDIQRQVVEKIDAKLPELNVLGTGCNAVRWGRGALGDDGCIYFFPHRAIHILKIDPSKDTLSSVGDNLKAQGRRKDLLFSGTVKADDGCLIGIPYKSKRIIKFDPKEPQTTTMVGEKAEEVFDCQGNGALGGDGNVYAMTRYGKILQINVANNMHSFVAEAPESTENGWYGAVAGKDGNIYFPPCNASRVLKYDISTMQASLVGDDLGDDDDKYCGGALNPIDGKIYCLPYSAHQVLSIDTNTATQTHRNSAKRTRDQVRAESSTTITDDHNRNSRRRTMVADSSSIGSANGCQNGTRSRVNIGKDDSDRNPRRQTRMVADSISSIGSANNHHPNNVRVEENVNVVQPHGGESDAVHGGGNDGDGQESTTMQRLLQVTRYVQLIQDMDNPHPTLLANAERMAETSAMLTDRYLEEIQNDKEESSNNDGSVHT